MFADYHVHSFYSDDSTAPMEDMVKRAVSMGLDEICFTEHVDHGVKAVTNCDYAAYFDGLAAMRARYGGQIAIRAGIEFGVQVHTVPLYEEDFRNWPFDFVIMSCHQVDDKEFWRGDFQRGKTQDEYHSAYYSEIDGCCQRFQNYSVLGHLDVIRRYDPAGEYPDEKTVPLAEPILRRVIADGKGIEINTSSFRYGLRDLTPSRRLLERYRDLGGELLTIGSDAHSPEHLADHIPEVRDLLETMGFRWFCTFAGMKPVWHTLRRV